MTIQEGRVCIQGTRWQLLLKQTAPGTEECLDWLLVGVTDLDKTERTKYIVCTNVGLDPGVAPGRSRPWAVSCDSGKDQQRKGVIWGSEQVKSDPRTQTSKQEASYQSLCASCGLDGEILDIYDTNSIRSSSKAWDWAQILPPDGVGKISAMGTGRQSWQGARNVITENKPRAREDTPNETQNISFRCHHSSAWTTGNFKWVARDLWVREGYICIRRGPVGNEQKT